MNKTKRNFLLFSGQTYYPAPGWKTYIDDFETLEEAIKAGKLEIDDEVLVWWQVVDIEKRIVVAGDGEAETGLFGGKILAGARNENE